MTCILVVSDHATSSNTQPRVINQLRKGAPADEIDLETVHSILCVLYQLSVGSKHKTSSAHGQNKMQKETQWGLPTHWRTFSANYTIFWTENPTKVLDGSKRQYIFEKDGNSWTETRGATCWATRTTNFLPCHITIVARTGRGIEQTSSDEGFW